MALQQFHTYLKVQVFLEQNGKQSWLWNVNVYSND